VTLLWEASTYVPPFYKGKSLYSAGADIHVVAIPQVNDSAGNPIPASDLTFKWEMNGDAYADHSGLGRDTLDFTGRRLDDEIDAIAVGITCLSSTRSYPQG
jgi:hypothetical protein